MSSSPCQSVGPRPRTVSPVAGALHFGASGLATRCPSASRRWSLVGAAGLGGAARARALHRGQGPAACQVVRGGPRNLDGGPRNLDGEPRTQGLVHCDISVRDAWGLSGPTSGRQGRVDGRLLGWCRLDVQRAAAGRSPCRAQLSGSGGPPGGAGLRPGIWRSGCALPTTEAGPASSLVAMLGRLPCGQAVTPQRPYGLDPRHQPAEALSGVELCPEHRPARHAVSAPEAPGSVEAWSPPAEVAIGS